MCSTAARKGIIVYIGNYCLHRKLLFTGLYVLNCPKGAQQENMTVTRAVRQTLSKQANKNKIK